MGERSKSSAIAAVKYDSFHVKTHISIVKLCCLLFFFFVFEFFELEVLYFS